MDIDVDGRGADTQFRVEVYVNGDNVGGGIISRDNLTLSGEVPVDSIVPNAQKQQINLRSENPNNGHYGVSENYNMTVHMGEHQRQVGANPSQVVSMQLINVCSTAQMILFYPNFQQISSDTNCNAAIVSTTDTVRIREKPAEGSATVTNVNNGESLQVFGKHQTSEWYYVEYDGQIGWIFGTLIDKPDWLANLPLYDENGNEIPPIEPPQLDPDVCSAISNDLNDNKNVRDEPSTIGTTILYTIGASSVGGDVEFAEIVERVVYADDAETWFKVATPTDPEGYVAALVTYAEPFGGPCDEIPVSFINRDGTSASAPYEEVARIPVIAATDLYDRQGELRLPDPFVDLPSIDTISSTQGYGMTEFAYRNPSIYEGTNRIHSGIDIFTTSAPHRIDDTYINENYGQQTDPCGEGNPAGKCLRIQAVCSGQIVGRGTTAQTYDTGIGIRCDMRDGTPSNIVVVYNHIDENPLPYQIDTDEDGVLDEWFQPPSFPTSGRYRRGQPMGLRVASHYDNPNNFDPHLHFEVFYVVNSSEYR